MKISDLIADLQDYLKNSGDFEVFVADQESGRLEFDLELTSTCNEGEVVLDILPRYE